ncbi:putative membrane-fusion protein [Desulforapulum autotrophicum HRM2]|uniref:Membrane-fusion protein n=1 Tax=Desulforapulum autotrophicum (strain ATCC 43914 / DSM 3382 / VKM B-1955 / HRM2) TaxID=177437 RepID=C0QFG4_DESAH|nr:efflux RND transporter periplasmic adaptor subunit [Desulforapulum autotrophicum]ACN13360.1 putative membrane-fusion protein [Desulforapulum autotrophicum HRM2]
MRTTGQSTKTPWTVKAIKIVLPLFILSAGIAIGVFLYQTKPAAKRGAPPAKVPLVEVTTAVLSDHGVVISALGAVTASRELALKSRVSGFVLTTSDRFVPGGIFKKGEILLRLDPRDFELALKKKKALVLKTEAELNLERGRQAVAKAELRLMERSSGKRVNEPGLALRKPQLAQVQADLETVKVDVEQAMVDLERTVIRAPFNCMIMDKQVEQGSQVTAQESLAVLAGTDAYWVTATIAMDQLQWIRFPGPGTDKGSLVQVFTRDNQRYQGEVFRLLGDVADKSRLARVLVSIKDPLGQNLKRTSPLLINAYVTLAIQGQTINNTIALPRRCARDGNTVWIARDRRLVVAPLDIMWKNEKTLFVRSGVKAGDKIIVSELSSAVNGMAIRVEESDSNGN